jgi:hypothetical protein
VLLCKMPDEPIAPNTYVFPFSIPLPKSLPCSRSYYEDENNGSFRIDYNIKLKTSSSGRKLPNIRAFQVSTAHHRYDDPVPCLLQPEPINIEDLVDIPGKGRIFFGAHVLDTKTARGQSLQVSLACRNQSSCRIKKVTVTLEEEYFWTAGPKGGHRKVRLIELDNVAKLPGFMLIGYHPSEIDDMKGNDEVVARKMFKDLKNQRNNLQLEIPYHAKESYTGLVVKISHALKLTLITEDDERYDDDDDDDDAKGVDCYPTMSVPIQIGGEPPRTMMGQAGSIHSSSDHVLSQPRKTFPMAAASPLSIVVGHSAGILDDDDSISEPIPPPTNDDPSLSEFLNELVSSISDYEFIDEKLKDLEWAIFLASLSPEEFGKVIGHVNVDFAQPRVAALLAQNFGGDFTCDHCAAGLQNTSPVFRSNIVEGLLTYCSDISENNFIIRENLSEFEQVIVALHALDVQENPAPPPPPPPPPKSSPESSGSSRSGLNKETQSGSRHKITSPMQKRRCHTGSSRHRRSVEGLTLEDDNSKPNVLDICIGKTQHTGTKEFYHFVKYVVSSSTQQEFSPPMFRRIKRKFKDRRFFIGPAKSETEWREVTNRELIDFIGGSYDAERIKQQSAHSVAAKKRGGYLQDTSDEWSLAISIHSYVSGLANDADDDDVLGPMSIDICFGKASHPGNSTLMTVIRRILAEGKVTRWGPPVYRAIKAKLKGRRFFVRIGENEWREATQVERRSETEKYYQHQAKAEEQHSSGKGTPVAIPKTPMKSPKPVKKRPSLEQSLGQLNDLPSLERQNSKGQLIQKHPLLEERKGLKVQSDGQPGIEKYNSKGQLIQKHPPQGSNRQLNGGPPERRNSKGHVIHKHPPMADITDSKGQLKERVVPNAMNRNSAVFRHRASAMSMKHPRDFDVCFGDDNHPGTNAFHLAVLDSVEQFQHTEWSPPVYKFIRGQLKGRRVFVRPRHNVPWREATAPERVEATRKYFEATRTKRKGPT